MTASSILRRNAKQFAPSNVLLDDDSCWNSDPGSPQWIELRLGARSTVSAVSLAFQGGFVGRRCVLEADVSPDGASAPEWVSVLAFSPEDVNDVQRFAVPAASQVPCRAVRITFATSSDFYGRVTLYSVKLFT